METYEKWLDPKTLKLIAIPGKELPAKPQSLLSLLNKIFQHLLATASDRDRLKVWQTLDRSGNTWWNAYDPATDRSMSVATEDEMRVWIEKRYYK